MKELGMVIFALALCAVIGSCTYGFSLGMFQGQQPIVHNTNVSIDQSIKINQWLSGNIFGTDFIIAAAVVLIVLIFVFGKKNNSND